MKRFWKRSGGGQTAGAGFYIAEGRHVGGASPRAMSQRVERGRCPTLCMEPTNRQVECHICSQWTQIWTKLRLEMSYTLLQKMVLQGFFNKENV